MRKIVAILLGGAMSISIFGTALAAEPDYKSGTPWPNIDLEGVVTEDMNASLKDNFALAVNKDKILKLQIPPGFPYAGMPADLTIQTNENLKKMFQGPAPQGHDAKLAYDYYQLMMDWDSRNAQGVTPLKKITDKVEAISSTTDLSRYLVDTPASKVKEVQGKLPILEKLKKNGYPDLNEYVVLMPAFFQKLNELYTEENLPLFKDYLIVHGAVDSAEALDRECYEEYYR